ncbi:hypothetical protein YC2023_087071 [Brassica napus]
MEETVESSVTEGESTIEKRDREAMREFEEGLDQPMDEEANMLKNMNKEKGLSMLMLLRLSFQSLGIVYGDLGTSPLYVFYNTFPDGINDSEDVIGALSLIIYSLLLIPLIKYVFIVCKANDNGQGGTLAIFSLLCRHANVNLIPNQQRSDENLTTYSRTLVAEGSFAAKTKKWLESRHSKKRALLVIVLLGTFLSATGGIKVNNPKMSTDIVVFVSIVILIGLFSMQHYGTDKVGWLFAPIVLIWFLFIGATVAFMYPPLMELNFSKINASTEALYADISYFPLQAIQLAFTLFVFPCLLLAYCGQAAYLVNHKEHYKDAFYASIPESVYWPMLIVATGAAIVGSQATISGTYSLIKQAVSHGDCGYGRDDCDHITDGADHASRVEVALDPCPYIRRSLASSRTVLFLGCAPKVKKYEFEVYSKVSMSWILGLGPSLGLVRVPGIGLVHTELASGVPHIFSHFITNLPAIHSVVVFVCVKNLPVYTVPEEERFMVKRIGPKTFRMFRCVARYGYKDLHRKDDNFENQLFDNLFSFIQTETMMESYSNYSNSAYYVNHTHVSRDELICNNNNYDNNNNNMVVFSSMFDTIIPPDSPHSAMSFSENYIVEEEEEEEEGEDELEFLKTCKETGVVHIMGNTVGE